MYHEIFYRTKRTRRYPLIFTQSITPTPLYQHDRKKKNPSISKHPVPMNKKASSRQFVPAYQIKQYPGTSPAPPKKADRRFTAALGLIVRTHYPLALLSAHADTRSVRRGIIPAPSRARGPGEPVVFHSCPRYTRSITLYRYISVYIPIRASSRLRRCLEDRAFFPWCPTP